MTLKKKFDEVYECCGRVGISFKSVFGVVRISDIKNAPMNRSLWGEYLDLNYKKSDVKLLETPK